MRNYWNLNSQLCAFSLGALIFISSCSTLQSDRMLSSDGGEGSSEISTLGAMIIPLDTGSSQDQLVSVRTYIADLNRKPIKDTVFEARLAAWAGRFALVEGRRSDAEKLLAQSLSLIPVDVPSLILSARLERDLDKRLEKLDAALSLEGGAGELLLEKALTLRDLRRYRESAAAFDAAFPILDSMYQSIYGEDRDTVWTLRDLAPGDNILASVMAKGQVTWKDAYTVLSTETTLLSFVTGGKTWSPEKIHTALVTKGYISLPLGGKAPSVTAILSRQEGARLLWSLRAEKKGDPSLLTRYSSRWTPASGRKSPVLDVPLDSAYFDGIMGCVEGEILSLPDGRNFFPTQDLSGADLIRAIRSAAR
jgi:tetratricopeptide (TPR) repeat protein